MNLGAPKFLNLALSFLSQPILSHRSGIAASSQVDVQSIGKFDSFIVEYETSIGIQFVPRMVSNIKLITFVLISYQKGEPLSLRIKSPSTKYFESRLCWLSYSPIMSPSKYPISLLFSTLALLSSAMAKLIKMSFYILMLFFGNISATAWIILP